MKDNRHDYIYQTTDPKSDEAVGTMIFAVMVLIGVLYVLQLVFETVAGWYYAAMNWASETAAYIASFWPF